MAIRQDKEKLFLFNYATIVNDYVKRILQL